jgi:hypothetical protein
MRKILKDKWQEEFYFSEINVKFLIQLAKREKSFSSVDST